MAFATISLQLSPEDSQVIHEQRALTNDINNGFIQVGAIYLKPKSKLPDAEDWAGRKYLDTRIQDWIDDPDLRFTNMGFNLQLGWLDIDIDSVDPEFNRCIKAALCHLKIDSRFAFGRKSVGVPTHFFVQLTEDDAANYEDLKKFEPHAIKAGDVRHKVQLRTSMNYSNKQQSMFSAQQTVVPGSIYQGKVNVNDYDLSVWWNGKGQIARTTGEIAQTTPHRVSYRELVRAVAFGAILFLVKSHWQEGERQSMAIKLFGWLARIVRQSAEHNSSEQLRNEVMCPIDCEEIADSLIELICADTGDIEPHMRKRVFHDALKKLEQNPDSKIPGWPSMEQQFGAEVVRSLRDVVFPGSDISPLNALIDRYIYDEADGMWVDRERFNDFKSFEYSTETLYQRHKKDTIVVNGKPYEAFKSFERCKSRVHVHDRDMFPHHYPGTIIRHSPVSGVVPDDYDGISSLYFNTWSGWAVKPVLSPNLELLVKCEAMLDRVLNYLTCNNPAQVLWIKKWLAYTLQFPGDKQQVAWVVLGGQGVGKSFLGNVFCNSIFGNLHGMCDGKVVGERFALSPFVGKMLVFVDEAQFKGNKAIDEMKLRIRNVRTNGELKGQDSRDYNIYARLIFASNRLDVGLGQANVLDRALYITKAYTAEFMRLTQAEFDSWTRELKPYFDEFMKMLLDATVKSHFMRMFMDMAVTRHELENVSSSSATDAAVMLHNLGWARRLAKSIIESGRLFEDTDISTPFTVDQFKTCVSEICKRTGDKMYDPNSVYKEFEDTGMFEKIMANRVNKIRFRWKIGQLHDEFGKAIGVPLTPQFEFGPEDYGPNDNDGVKPVQWRGLQRYRF